MEIHVAKLNLSRLDAGTIIMPVEEGKPLEPPVNGIDRHFGERLAKEIESSAFRGGFGEAASALSLDAATRLIALGFGTDAKTPEKLRRWGAFAIKEARKARAKRISILVPYEGSAEDACAAVAEGILLGDYRFLDYKKDAFEKHLEGGVDTVTLLIADSHSRKVQSGERGVKRAIVMCDATSYARDLVNECASRMTPRMLVNAANAIAEAEPERISVKIHDERRLEALGAGGVLAVGNGSDEPSFMIHLTYRPPATKKVTKKRVAIVGKGITFDSGGLSLKDATGMQDMKIDMAGCAAMLGVFTALAKLEPDVEVHGISAVCENMPSGKAIRPGDVVRTIGGKTIEILNTDAEGRVTLADALCYAVKLGPDAIIDIATLTGACMGALGTDIAGLFSNDEKLSVALLSAANAEGEALWKLPLFDPYRKMMESTVADLKNISSVRFGGAITAATFLEEFVGKVPWAHIDMAGPAHSEKGSAPHQPPGATGFGVRTLLHYLLNL